MTDGGLLVPVTESVTVRQTVGYAVRRAREEGLTLHFVVAIPYDTDVPEGERTVTEAAALLDRVQTWAREDAADQSLALETAVLGTDEYLFGPQDYAQVLAEYADTHGIERVLLDPEYEPGTTTPLLQPLERELTAVGLQYEEAPVERPARRERLVAPQSLGRLAAMFGISYLFYLTIGDPTYWFDLLTGAAVAGIVAVTLSQVTFTTAPTGRTSPMRLVRFLIYIPYLLWEIIRANIAVALVILRPSMPIEPTMCRFNARVRSGLPLVTLANSITLTPGTLTVRANDQRLLIHTLIPGAREDLFDGGLERAVRFVFYGRLAAAIPTPRERGDAEIVGGDEE